MWCCLTHYLALIVYQNKTELKYRHKPIKTFQNFIFSGDNGLIRRQTFIDFYCSIHNKNVQQHTEHSREIRSCDILDKVWIRLHRSGLLIRKTGLKKKNISAGYSVPHSASLSRRWPMISCLMVFLCLRVFLHPSCLLQSDLRTERCQFIINNMCTGLHWRAGW